MMDKEKLQQDIDAMREKLAEMEAKLQEKKKEKKYFIPELGDDYWTLNSWGAPILEEHVGAFSDIHKIAVGRCYKTPEEAKKADAKQKAYVRIVRALRDHEEESLDCKCFIYFDHRTSSYNVSGLVIFGNKDLVSTKDACKWVIDNMEDDLKVYFGE
jgi:pyridoxine 5'-phosphate synthase PdxJ